MADPSQLIPVPGTKGPGHPVSPSGTTQLSVRGQVGVCVTTSRTTPNLAHS